MNAILATLYSLFVGDVIEILFQRPLRRISQRYSVLLNRGYLFWPFLILVAALAMRIAYSFYGPHIGDQIWSDMRIYTGIGDKITNGIWDKAHFFQSIGYPLLIALLRKIYTPAGYLLSTLQAICSFLTVYFMYQLTLKSLGRKVALIALIIGTCHLPWILYGNFALPETIFTCLLAACGHLSFELVEARQPRKTTAALFGLFFIMAFWLKGTAALWAPLFLTGLFFKNRKASLIPIAVMGFAMALGLTAHGIFTKEKIGIVQLSASTSGLNFIEGKCPSKQNSDSAGYTWLSPLYFQIGLHQAKKWDRPFTDSKYYMQQGLKCIQDDPFVLVQSLESIPFLFFGNIMWPFNQKPIARYARLYELFFAIFLIVGLSVYLNNQLRIERNMSEILIWVIPVLSIFLTVYIFKSEIRYRVPFDVWFIPVAVKGWLTLSRTQ